MICQKFGKPIDDEAWIIVAKGADIEQIAI
jgi:hypothetical protein